MRDTSNCKTLFLLHVFKYLCDAPTLYNLKYIEPTKEEFWVNSTLSASSFQESTGGAGPERRSGGGELNKLAITDGWQWKVPPWDRGRLVVWGKSVSPSGRRCWPVGVNLLSPQRWETPLRCRLQQVTAEPNQNAIGRGTHPTSEGRGGVGKSFCRRETWLASIWLGRDLRKQWKTFKTGKGVERRELFQIWNIWEQYFLSFAFFQMLGTTKTAQTLWNTIIYKGRSPTKIMGPALPVFWPNIFIA